MIGRRQIVGLLAVALIALLAILWLRRSPGEEEEFTPNVSVHVQEIRRGTLRHLVTAYGTVEPAPPMEGQPAAGALITSFVEGIVSEVNAVEGRRVAAGQVLVRLDSRMARVAVERAQVEADVADKARQRQEALLTSDGTSQKDYQDAKARADAAQADLAAAQTQLAYLSIGAPLAGTVLNLAATVGQHVDANAVLAEVVDLDRLVVSARVPAREIGSVAVGQRVLLGLGDSVPEGTVRILGRDVDATTGTYVVQASVPSEAGFMPGQFTQVRIVAEEHQDVLVVPEGSVITRPDEGTWIVVVDGDTAVRRPVTVGFRDQGLAEVAGEGIEVGMSVVTDEAYGLPEETTIQVVGS